MTDTTTEEVVQQEGGEQPQPEPVQQAEAGTPAPEEKQEQAEPAKESDNSDSFDANAWLEKKGLDPTSPETVLKLAKAQHEAEQKMHNATSEASKLKKDLEAQPVQQVSTDPLVQQLYERQIAAERNFAISNFKREVGLTPEKEAKMVSYMAEHPEKGQLVNAGYMTLHELYMLSGAGSVDPGELKTQGKQEALQQLANKQMAAAVSGAATKHTGPSTPEERLKELWSS